MYESVSNCAIVYAAETSPPSDLPLTLSMPVRWDVYQPKYIFYVTSLKHSLAAVRDTDLLLLSTGYENTATASTSRHLV